jgi:ribosome-binding protein aMBF1 (putative translation factor)
MLRLLKQIEALLRQQGEERRTLDALWIKFGQTVRQTRIERDRSLVELAAKMGLSKSKLSYIENGERSWDLTTAAKAIEALK